MGLRSIFTIDGCFSWDDSPSFRVLATTVGRRFANEIIPVSAHSETAAIAWLKAGPTEAVDDQLEIGRALTRVGLDANNPEARKHFAAGFRQVVDRRRQRSIDSDTPALAGIHAVANHQKALAYWVGFLRGVLASEDIERLEVPPLVVEARNFLNLLGAEEAEFLVGDLPDLQIEDRRRAFDLIQDIVERRAGGLLVGPKDQVNEFYGFCAGIACDNRITIEEVQKLLARITPDLLKDSRVESLDRAVRMAIDDGKITDEESLDICDWITRLVGDSASDTGLATYGNAAVVDGAVQNPGDIVFNDRSFVLTGKFEIGPRKAIAAMIVKRGGRWYDDVTQGTDYLAIAGAGSAHWKFSHASIKLTRAYELRQEGGRPELISEDVLARAFVL